MISSQSRDVSGETAASIARKHLTSIWRRGSIDFITARDPTMSAANPSHLVRLFFPETLRLARGRIVGSKA
jgi:hypothetical protein